MFYQFWQLQSPQHVKTSYSSCWLIVCDLPYRGGNQHSSSAVSRIQWSIHINRKSDRQIRVINKSRFLHQKIPNSCIPNGRLRITPTTCHSLCSNVQCTSNHTCMKYHGWRISGGIMRFQSCQQLRNHKFPQPPHETKPHIHTTVLQANKRLRANITAQVH